MVKVFTYPGPDRPSVQGISITVVKRQTVGLVRATGAAKPSWRT